MQILNPSQATTVCGGRSAFPNDPTTLLSVPVPAWHPILALDP